MKTFYLLLIFLISICCSDPRPSGGAICLYNWECNTYGGGTCDNGTCKCIPAYGNPNCNYKRKDRSLATGLQFLCLIGIGGVGNLILDNIMRATYQFILVGMSFVLTCMVVCAGPNRPTKLKIIGIILFVITLSGMMWCIVDAVNISKGNITDGLGYATYYYCS